MFSGMLADGDNGGAISCKSSSITITLTSCSIINCNSTMNGGGVYVSGDSNTLTVDECLLKDCVTTSGESFPGGGGLYMIGSTSSLAIHSSTFLRCKANVLDYGGGGFHTGYMKSVILSSSRILFCSTTNSGGGVYINQDTPVSYFNTLFIGNSAVVYGGAIRELSNVHSSVVHLKYLFFTTNTAAETYGYDLSVKPEISDSPFLHSFSTLPSNRVSIAIGTTSTYSQNNNWLPLGSLSYLNTPHETYSLHPRTISIL